MTGMGAIQFRFARPSDGARIQSLLSKAGLPSTDICEHLDHAIVAVKGGQLLGGVAMEIRGKEGLLRSLVVADGYRGHGLGKSLCQHMIAAGQASGVQRLFLRTTSAEQFFKKLGFSRTPQKVAPPAIRSSNQFKGLCPVTAVCMKRNIGGEIRCYPREAMRMIPDVPGSKLWAVCLNKTMLTYFEVEPNRRFPMHHHASEQITYVIEGELFFQTEERETHRLRAGDSIAVPSNLRHAVFTRGKAARAVDAWSPLMPKYRQ